LETSFALASFSLEPLHLGAFDFAVGFLFLQIFAFVVLRFAFADAQRDFYLAVLPIERKRHERVAFDGSEAEKFSDFGFVQQKFPDGLGLVILEIALRVFVNVRVVEKNLVALHAGEGIPDLPLSGAQCLHFRAAQNDARLVGFEDVIIPPGFRVGDDVSHKTNLRFTIGDYAQPNKARKSYIVNRKLKEAAAKLPFFGAFLRRWPREFHEFGHFEADFVLDDFGERDVRHAHARGRINKRTAHGAGAGIELAHAA
jgi:hypothetical protein